MRQATRRHHVPGRPERPEACGAALLCQLVYISHLVRIRDWSSLLDTADAVVFAAAVLVAVTALLDLLALLLHRELTGESRP